MSDPHQLIVVANRLPVRNVSDRDGQRWVGSPGDLVGDTARTLKLLCELRRSWLEREQLPLPDHR